jgi:hypothetical protein
MESRKAMQLITTGEQQDLRSKAKVYVQGIARPNKADHVAFRCAHNNAYCTTYRSQAGQAMEHSTQAWESATMTLEQFFPKRRMKLYILKHTATRFALMIRSGSSTHNK